LSIEVAIDYPAGESVALVGSTFCQSWASTPVAGAGFVVVFVAGFVVFCGVETVGFVVGKFETEFAGFVIELFWEIWESKSEGFAELSDEIELELAEFVELETLEFWELF